MLEMIQAFLAQHGVAITMMTAWSALSAILTLALRIKTVAQWEAQAETYPRFAAFCKVLRAVGVDPVSALEAVVALVLAKGSDSKPKQAGYVKRHLMFALAVFAITISVIPGCSWFQKTVPAIAVPSVALYDCISSDAQAGKTIGQIVVDCDGDLMTVVNILIESAMPQVVGSPAHSEAVIIKAKVAAKAKK